MSVRAQGIHMGADTNGMRQHTNKIIAGFFAAVIVVTGGSAWAVDHHQKQEQERRVADLLDALDGTVIDQPGPELSDADAEALRWLEGSPPS